MLIYKIGGGKPQYIKSIGDGLENNPYQLITGTEEKKAPIIIAALGESKTTTTIAIETIIDTTTINVVDSTGMAIGQNIFIVDDLNNIVETFEVLGISANAISIDTPVGHVFAIGTYVGTSNINMAVDGSTTPVIFNLKTGIENADITTHLTRIILVMKTATAPSVEKFGDITALTKGIYLRKKNGEAVTYFNAKTNGKLMGLAYDVDFLDAAKFGEFGVKMRLTFEKMGSIIELAQGEDLELVIQDDLTSLITMVAVVEGHIAI